MKMEIIARSSTLQHPAGEKLTTPLLIPSFSSKGFGVDKKGISEINTIFDTIGKTYLTESQLVSAYDLHYKHIPKINYANVALTFVDSGGYETNSYQDFSSVFQLQVVAKARWSKIDLQTLYRNWPKRVPAVFVNYDSQRIRTGFKQQIKSAEEFLRPYPHLHTILLKPTKSSESLVDINKLFPHIEGLKKFHIIGITEKELGNSMLDRMLAIGRLRRKLDEHDIKTPLHIFGSLDPISSPLYFLAGAEIFDGLTWLRYAYEGGKAIYFQNRGVSHNINEQDHILRPIIHSHNATEMKILQAEMRTFLVQKKFNVFTHNAKLFESRYTEFLSKL